MNTELWNYIIWLTLHEEILSPSQTRHLQFWRSELGI